MNVVIPYNEYADDRGAAHLKFTSQFSVKRLTAETNDACSPYEPVHQYRLMVNTDRDR